MKRFYTILACLLALPAFLSAAEIVRLTRYDGQAISGVSAGDMFNVELVKSDQTKAVVEIDSEVEQYLHFELKSGGIISVDLKIPQQERRRLQGWINEGRNRINRTIKLTVYLPEIHYIKLKDMATLKTQDHFSSDRIEIKTEDMGKIHGITLNVTTATVKAEDMAQVNLALTADQATFKADDMAKINVTGESREAFAESNDMARINGSEFKTDRGTLKASDMAKTSMFVSYYLYARSSDMASVDYKGEPSQIDLKTPRRTIYNINE